MNKVPHPLNIAALKSSGVFFAQSHFAFLAQNTALWTLLGLFYLAGLALSFTPCCLPLVPILSSLIVKQSRKATPMRSFALSLTYVLGMALTYTAAGALFGAAGEEIQATLQRPWVLLSFAGLFVLLALSLFGLFSIQMPTSIQTRLTLFSNRQKAGSFFGVAAMGALSALLVTTCITPALIGALALISHSGDALRGAVALFAMSLGMGTPLLLVGTAAGSLLPKPGPWMILVKRLFGVLMLAMAVWVLQRIVPLNLGFSLWSLPLFATALVLLASTPRDPAQGWPLLALGLIATLTGIFLFFRPILSGQFSHLHRFPLPATEHSLSFTPVRSLPGLERAIAKAKHEDRPAMLDFYANWCSTCQEMADTTFQDPAVRKALSGVVLLRVDLTSYNKEDRILLRHFGVFGPPTVLFFDRRGKERTAYRVIGYMSPTRFLHATRAALHRGYLGVTYANTPR